MPPDDADTMPPTLEPIDAVAVAESVLEQLAADRYDIHPATDTTLPDPPTPILGPGNNPDHWEPSEVVAKYSQAHARIGETNTDYVALGYMSHQAAAYWLPRFCHYLRTQAPPDTFHFDVVLSLLADPDRSQPIRALTGAAAQIAWRDSCGRVDVCPSHRRSGS